MFSTTSYHPLIVIICLLGRLEFERQWAPLVSELRYMAEVHILDDPNQIQALLRSQSGPAVVLIADPALALDEHTLLWGAVLSHMQRGGTSILMGQFPAWLQDNSARSFFRMAGLSWVSGTTSNDVLWELNTRGAGDAVRLSLPSSSYMEGTSIRNVPLRQVWYTRDLQWARSAHLDATGPGESFVAMAQVGMGRLGYMGAMSCEIRVVDIIHAMCAL